MAEEVTEEYTGADCTGSSGDSNRVLTLSNTGLTKQNGFLVYVSGLALALTSEYTVTHNAGSSTVTFLNPLFDDMTIIVRYLEEYTAELANDFVNGPLANLGVTVVRTPVTTDTDFHGDKSYSEGATENITVVFQNTKTEYKLDEAGLTRVYDARMFIKPDQTMVKYDKITYDGREYRVDTVSERNFNGTAMYKLVTLFYINDA